MRRKALEQTLQTKSNLNIFQGFFQASLTNNLPIAVWRLPHENKQNVVVDLSGKAQQLKLDLEESRPGFAFSRFLNPDLKHTYFLNADVHYSTAAGSIEYLTSPRAMDAAWHQSQQHFLQAFEEALDAPFGKKAAPKTPLPHRLHIASEADYTQLVSQGVAAIKAKKFNKVVLSRAKSVDLPPTFDHVQTFMNLCQRYANAMVYLVYIPNVGLWMGATPETLISTDAQQHFRTIALAGTQAYNPDLPLSHTAWMQKEIEEQAMVGRYIVNCFKKIRLREFEEVGPKTVIAGNLVHLCTHFRVDMQAVNFAELGTVMLDLLHPTSAVCGMPKEASQDFILEHEHYDRGFYSGFIGPVNIAQASHIFVNLRCMQILKDQAILYAGAGITEDSIPAREWHETEMKCKTMLDIIQ
jgi:isochorismate synthase